MKARSLLVVLLSCCVLVGVVILSGCGGSGNAPAWIAAVPTVAYLPPTVVANTAVPTTAPTSTATATPRPSGPPRPTPTPFPVPPGPNPVGAVPNIGGQLILVSLSQQWLWAYRDHRMVYRSPVTTGMPQLPTPDGTFHVQYHESNGTFISPWPLGSPYYYSPEHVNYAMYFLDWGYFIHDAPWRQVFGPGTNYPHTDPNGQKVTGSHGCVELPTSTMSWHVMALSLGGRRCNHRHLRDGSRAATAADAYANEAASSNAHGDGYASARADPDAIPDALVWDSLGQAARSMAQFRLARTSRSSAIRRRRRPTSGAPGARSA